MLPIVSAFSAYSLDNRSHILAKYIHWLRKVSPDLAQIILPEPGKAFKQYFTRIIRIIDRIQKHSVQIVDLLLVQRLYSNRVTNQWHRTWAQTEDSRPLAAAKSRSHFAYLRCEDQLLQQKHKQAFYITSSQLWELRQMLYSLKFLPTRMCSHLQVLTKIAPYSRIEQPYVDMASEAIFSFRIEASSGLGSQFTINHFF